MGKSLNYPSPQASSQKKLATSSINRDLPAHTLSKRGIFYKAEKQKQIRTGNFNHLLPKLPKIITKAPHRLTPKTNLTIGQMQILFFPLFYPTISQTFTKNKWRPIRRFLCYKSAVIRQCKRLVGSLKNNR